MVNMQEYSGALISICDNRISDAVKATNLLSIETLIDSNLSSSETQTLFLVINVIKVLLGLSHLWFGWETKIAFTVRLLMYVLNYRCNCLKYKILEMIHSTCFFLAFIKIRTFLNVIVSI